MTTIVAIDGTLVTKPVISIFDRGFLYGDGAFTVLRTLADRPVDLGRHLDRLYGTVPDLRVLAREPFEMSIREAVAAAGPGDHRIRLVLTRGEGTLATPPASCGPGRAIAIVEPLGPQPREIAAAIVDLPVLRRTTKTLAYVEQLHARELARAAGAGEAIRLDRDGKVVEGATSNVFAVVRDELVTPPLESGALPGIVRSRILELTEKLIEVRERPLAVPELREASEIFITSSLRGVVAVTQLDGVPREAGPITARMAGAYRDALHLYI